MLPAHFPTPEFYVPGQGEPSLRWGVIAPGWIAGFFVDALLAHTAQSVVAVGSRSRERGEAFAAQHGIPRAHDSYEALVADPQVDVVYVASPPSEHLAQGRLAIAAGKHVLIEKPLATSAADAQSLVDEARAAGVFLMEAMWSRYQPQNIVIRSLLADGVLGEVLAVSADHGQAMPFDPTGRMYDPALGGGALLDLGIYPIQFDSMVLGAPSSVTAIGGLASTGVDAYSTLTIGHGDRAQSTLTTNLLVRTPTVASIAGTEGRVDVAGPFHIPTSLTLFDTEFFGREMHWEDPTPVRLMDGLSWQATALARFVGEDRHESPVHTHAETVQILATIDEARRQLGAA